jgi:hypothetical protein
MNVYVQVGANLLICLQLSKRAVNPSWDETIQIPVKDGSTSITVTVKASALLRNIFLGRCVIPLVEVAANPDDTGLTKLFTLLTENLQFSETTKGTVQLNLKWVYDAKFDEEVIVKRRSALDLIRKSMKSMGKVISKRIIGESEETQSLLKKDAAGISKGHHGDDDDAPEIQDDETNEMTPFELELYLKEQARKRKLEMKDILEIEEPEIDLKDGDYTIQVHIIEVSALRATNSSGASDPFVTVELMGQKHRTTWFKEELSAYYDQTFYFNFKDLKKEQIQEAQLKLTVWDHNYFRSHEFIGVYSVDLVSIYQNKDHEIYRALAALRDPMNKVDSGVMGLIKFSAIVLGPNDTQKIHDQSNEDEESERDLAVADGVALATGALPGSQRLQFLVVSILRVDGLTGFDKFLQSSTGLYAFAKLEFAGCAPQITTKVKVSGKRNASLTINFEEELWIPIWVPTLCRRGVLTIVHRQLGFWDSVVATAHIDFDALPRYPYDPVVATGLGSFIGLTKKSFDGQPFELLHFYGADAHVKSGTPAARFTTNFPQFGSAYRGSAVCSMRVIENNTGVDYAHIEKMDYYIPDAKLPVLVKYMLRVLVYQGSDLGSTGHAASNGTYFAPSYALSINIGTHTVRTPFQNYTAGACDWAEILEAVDILLPLDLRQLPDMFITLLKGNEYKNTPIAFHRLKSLAIMPGGLKNAPKWYELKHDMSHKRQPPGYYPGSVLLKMALMNMQDIDDRSDWESERKRMMVKKPFGLRAFIYQVKNLPSVDDNGLMDPYVKIRFAGEKRKTETKPETVCPTYYSTLEFSTMLPEDRNLCPYVTVQVWDANNSGSIPICALRIPASDIEVAANSFQRPPAPKWMSLKGIDNVGNMGEILCSFLLLPKKELIQSLSSPPELKPEMKRVYLDLHILGLRKLQKLGMMRLNKPFIQFSYNGDKIQTSAVKTPNPENPNYLDRYILPVPMPEDPLFTPILEVRVFDQRIGGSIAGNLLIGTISVDLSNKLPWNGGDYIPPRNHTMLESNIMARKQLVEERARKEGRAKAKVQMTEAEVKAAEIADKYNQEQEALTLTVKDDGVGVFPIEPGASEFGAQYQELPPVVEIGMPKVEATGYGLSVGAGVGALGDLLSAPASRKIGGMDEELRKMIGFPTAWASNSFLTGREEWIQSGGGPLEDKLMTSPFESYDLMRGHISFNKFGKRKNTIRKVGIFKGVIIVTQKNPRNNEEYNKFAKRIRELEECVVRVYAIRAQSLMPVDLNGKADPYLKVTLGSTVKVDDSEAKKMNEATLNPEFYRRYDFETTLPGPSALSVAVWDSNSYLPDRFLGETIVDLEDRWFHATWTKMGDLKQLEARNIYREDSRTTQGIILMWVDIFTKTEAQRSGNAPIQIEAPKKANFEIRIVCWRSMDIPKMPGGSDLFVRFKLEGEGQSAHDTDTHWKCKSGAASWNWRIKLPMELPIKTRELGRLKMQVYERNLITSNELIGEAVVNLYDWLLLAYHRQTKTILPYKEIKEAYTKQRRQKELADTAPELTAADDEEMGFGDDDMDGDEFKDDIPVADAINGDSENTPLLDKKGASARSRGKDNKSKGGSKGGKGGAKSYQNDGDDDEITGVGGGVGKGGSASGGKDGAGKKGGSSSKEYGSKGTGDKADKMEKGKAKDGKDSDDEDDSDDEKKKVR